MRINRFKNPRLMSQGVGRVFSVMIILFLLSTCSSGPDKEIQAFVKNTRAQKTKDPAPIPEFKNNIPCQYEAGHLRNPFEGYAAAVSTSLSNGQLIPISQGRPRDPLEHYPLESLRMVGYLEKNQGFLGLVKDKQGSIHTVSVDHYIGQNGGKITKIYPDGIEIEEVDGNNEKKKITLSLLGS